MSANDVREPELRLEIPAIEEYRALRVAAGLSAMTAEGAATGFVHAAASAPKLFATYGQCPVSA